MNLEKISQNPGKLITNITAGLKPESKEILSEAYKNGCISFEQLGSLIPLDCPTRDSRIRAIRKIRDCLHLLSIKVVTDSLFLQLSRTGNSHVDLEREGGREEKEKAEKELAGQTCRSILDQYCNEVRRERGTYTGGEFTALAYRALNGDIEARNEIATRHLGLVVAIARKSMYRAMKLGSSVGLLDLIQEGNIGLLEAASRYDPDFNARFSTYAAWWIWQYVRRAVLNQARTVRVPLHSEERWRVIWRATQEPTVEELAISIGLPREKIEKAFLEMWATPGYTRSMVQLDAQCLDGRRNFHEVISSNYILDPEKLMMAREELEVAYRRIKNIKKVAERIFSRKDYMIFQLRYGLDDFSLSVRTFRDIAKNPEVPVTFQRAKQIIDTHIWKRLLKHGVPKGEKWLLGEIRRIRILEEFVSEKATEVLKAVAIS